MIFPMMMVTQKKYFLLLLKALSFTRLSADQLGQRLLRWSGHYSGDQQVSSKKVWKSKKKNKGRKREQWWAQVKEYHNKQNDGDQTAANGGGGASPNDGGSMFGNNFPDAPWNTQQHCLLLLLVGCHQHLVKWKRFQMMQRRLNQFAFSVSLVLRKGLAYKLPFVFARFQDEVLACYEI